MFDLFTDDARLVVAVASRVAARYGHDYISGLHILVAVLENDPTVNETLKAASADPDLVRSTALELLAARAGAPDAKQAIYAAMDQAKDLQSREVNPHHVLLGVLSTLNPPLIAAFDRVSPGVEGMKAALIRHIKPQ